MPRKDPYDILGVSRTATPEEIRKAYILRSKMLHPDRFDPATQREEWDLANDMLKDLNSAYAALKDPASRRDHDRGYSSASGPSPASPPPQPAPSRANTGASTPNPAPQSRATPRSSAGTARFADLPPKVRERLLDRVSGRNKVQFAVTQGGVGWNYFWAIVLAAWFFYLFSSASTSLRWDEEERKWLMGISAAVALLQGLNIHRIVRWHRSHLKAWLFITPLHIIKTRFDRVWFWPIWELSDIHAVHHHKNGSYQYTSVTMVFPNGKQLFTVTPELAYPMIVRTLQTFQDKVRLAVQQGDSAYFHHEDDFRELGANPPAQVTPPKRALAAGIIGASFAIHTLAFSVAAATNTARPTHRTHEVLPLASSSPGSPSRYTPEPSTHDYDYQTPESDFYRPAPRDTPTYMPPLLDDYSFLSPAVEPAKPKRVVPAFTEPELPLPVNGEVRTFRDMKRIAPFQIQSSYDSHHLVKLSDAATGRSVLTIFVRGGTTVEAKVPLGTYTVKYASGDKWYGDLHLFGPETTYSKADDPFNFHRLGDEINGYTITLYKVADGNLLTEEIEPEEF
jgi:hypothetical protein